MRRVVAIGLIVALAAGASACGKRGPLRPPAPEGEQKQQSMLQPAAQERDLRPAGSLA